MASQGKRCARKGKAGGCVWLENTRGARDISRTRKGCDMHTLSKRNRCSSRKYPLCAIVHHVPGCFLATDRACLPHTDQIVRSRGLR